MKLGWLNFGKTEHRASYGDTLVDAILSQAQGTLTAQAHQTAAVEFGAGLLERCFAVADVDPEALMRRTLTPRVLANMARSLILTGNSVSAVDTSTGELLLLPASNYDVTGGSRESSWRYRLELAGPSRIETRRLPSTSVVHIRMGASPQTPWQGVSPLINAGLSASLLGRLERRMAQEVNSRVGHLLIHPELTDAQQEQLARDLKLMEGGVSLLETGSAGHGQGNRNAPQTDWASRRIGAHVPAENIQLREQASGDVLAAMGVPAPLFHGTDGVSAREAYRLLLVTALQPIAELISSELETKIETPVKIGFRRLHAADIQSRARALAGMIASGVDKETAMEISGLES